MKPNSRTLSSLRRIALIAGCFGAIGCLNAQEELLDQALRDRERRKSGLTAIADSFKTFLARYLPEGTIDIPEEIPPVPETAAKIAVREVKVTEAPAEVAAAADGVAAAQAADEEKIYRETLQVAVGNLDIKGAFPQRKQIMIGARSLAVGDDIAIEYKERFYNLKILDVTAAELKLRDEKTQSAVSIAIGISLGLPPGMSRTPPPGMFVTRGENPQNTIVPANGRPLEIK